MTLREENARLRQENEALRGEVSRLMEQVAELAAALAATDKKTKPPAFVKANKAKPAQKKKRKKRAAEHNRGRRQEEPTRHESHRLVACPDCGHELAKQKESYRRQVVDIIEPAPVEVVEHRVEAGWCPQCRCWQRPVVNFATGQGQGRLGVRIRGLVGYLRSVLRLPYRQIQQYLATVHRLKVSVGELVNLNRQLAMTSAAERNGLLAEARGSPHLHMDETGWREDGQNGYIWCLVTDEPQAVRYYEYHQSRAGRVAGAMLGEEFRGVLVTDFYGGYNQYEGRHQRCWVHLLRDLATLREEQWDDAAIVAWCVGVKNLYHEARQLAQADLSAADRQAMVTHLVEMTRQFGLLYAQEAHACRPLAKRLIRHMTELYQFVSQPTLSADNNLAERALRPLVVQRKVSGGSRSALGSQTQMQLATLFQTWLARGLNPLLECWRLLGYEPAWAIPQ
ncbi:MAG: IS66 family transposase [Anaerolineales bacterium]|nr:IS66 family transposase [Anaerolineales bacterium]MCB0009053.1 IS66 family transposase [Anaerolineales bacterium]MCB0031932.1 IS66 family transposase [Anaerolineales bacterium]